MKVYLIHQFQGHDKFLNKVKEGDVIDFEMPPFCSGDYHAKVYKDKHGLYIDSDDNFYAGCRDFSIL